MIVWRDCFNFTFLLAVLTAFIFEHFLSYHSLFFRECEAEAFALQTSVILFLAIWFGVVSYLIFNRIDLPLIALVSFAIFVYIASYDRMWVTARAAILLATVTFSRGTSLLLENGVMGVEPKAKDQRTGVEGFLITLVLLLGLSSCWQPDINGPYYTTRWIGMWDNPNTYGMLMGTGVVLAVGLLATEKAESGKRKAEMTILLISAGMMGVGLVFSYSRGAWLGTAVSLLYLANAYRKLKWPYVLPGIVAIAAVVCFFWNATPDSAPWYVKRMDLGRPSAQHRVAAWKAGFEIMRDHPFGVGWNKTVEIYQEHYSPPANGAAAITTNDYLMLGTQLGIPALLCFLTYVALCFGAANWWRKWRRKSLTEDYALPASDPKFTIQNSEFKIKAACRAAALSLLVAFWFDDGLFQLPTAAVFWILLELGASNSSPNEK